MLRACLLPIFLATLLPAAVPTYSHDVAPILYKHCAACHHSNDIAPMSLMTYQEVKPWAAAIKEAVLTRNMPPWKADPHVGKWSNDPSLTPGEIAILKAWAEGGKPEGNPKDRPIAPVFEEGWHAGKPDVVFSIPEVKIVGAAGTDEYRQITVPTNFTEDRWVVSAELRAGNRKVVHHAHVFVVDPPDPNAMAKPKAAPVHDPAKEFGAWVKIKSDNLTVVRPEAPVINDGCAIDDNAIFPGSTKSDLGSLISSYLPGREADVYPEGTARLVKAGSKLNFSIHYARSGKPETDITSVGIVFAKAPPRTIARRIDLSNHMFMIPAGATDHEVTECHTFQKDMLITSLTPHMHLRGKSMKIELTYPDGRSTTVLNVPQYNFNWQITYRTADPVYLPKGTRLKITAKFDNSKNNPMNPDPTRNIRWGEASESEMMDGWIEYIDAKPTPVASTVAAAPHQ